MSLFDRLAAALNDGHARDIDLLPGDGRHQDWPEDAVPAAVLIAVTDRPEPGVILTQRPETMRRHPGQIAFPGGKMDAEDASLIAAALREAEEEVGLSANHVSIVGTTDIYRTITGYQVTPVIGIIPPDLPLRANEEEVAGIFEAPLAFLLDSSNHEWREAEYKGKTRRYFEINWQNRRIWGATAAMIVNLSRRLQWQG